MYFKKQLCFFYNVIFACINASYIPINTLCRSNTIDKFSTYINFKLSNNEYKTINNFINKNILNNILNDNSNKFYLDKLGILKDNNIDYYLSINIYNCSLFNSINNNYITCCEISTYIKDVDNREGRIILDYASSVILLDSETLIKSTDKVSFNTLTNNLYGNIKGTEFVLDYQIHNLNRYHKNYINPKFIEYNERVYNNGVYNKLYYDSTLITNYIALSNNYNIQFKFLNIEFNNPESVFCFKEPINYVSCIFV